MSSEKISVVIPCYFSEKTIAPIVHKVEDVLEKEKYDYEVILVDDGSKDRTYDQIQKLAKENQHIKGVRFSKNFGQHAALMAGYKYSSGDIIVGLNDDGEQDPSDMIKLISKIKEGYDYVCAKHELKKHAFFKRLGSRFNNYCCIHFLNQPSDFRFSSYYAMTRFLINELIKNDNPFINVNGLILTITQNVADVDIPAYERKEGQSGYSLRKSILLWANSFTAYTAAPLHLNIYIGIFFGVLSILGLLVMILLFIASQKVGAIILLFLAFFCFAFSLLFIMQGLMGEYVARTYMLLNGKQQFVMKESINL